MHENREHVHPSIKRRETDCQRGHAIPIFPHSLRVPPHHPRLLASIGTAFVLLGGTIFSVSDEEFSVACGGSCTTHSTTLEAPPAPEVESTVPPTTNVTPGPTPTVEEAISTPLPSIAPISEITPGPTPGSRALHRLFPQLPTGYD